MSSIEQYRTLFEYNYALYERLWDSLMKLSDEQFTQEVAYSHGSLRNQIVHVVAVEGRWLRGLKELPEARAYTLTPSDYPSRVSAWAIWDTTAIEVTRFVKSLDDQSLGRTPQGMSGPVWQILAHMVNHGTDHRAQMLRILHDFGAPTFDQDLILYLWSH